MEAEKGWDPTQSVGWNTPKVGYRDVSFPDPQTTDPVQAIIQCSEHISPRRGVMAYLDRLADDARSEERASGEIRQFMNQMGAVQIGRGLQRSINHIQAFPIHALCWTATALLVGRLHPFSAALPFLTGLLFGCIGNSHALAALSDQEKDSNTVESIDRWLGGPNQGIGALRDLINQSLIPCILLPCALLVAARLKSTFPTMTLWPVTLPTCMAAAAVEGHYLGNEV